MITTQEQSTTTTITTMIVVCARWRKRKSRNRGKSKIGSILSLTNHKSYPILPLYLNKGGI